MVQTIPMRGRPYSHPLGLPYTFGSWEGTVGPGAVGVPIAAPSGAASLAVGFLAITTSDNNADEIRVYFDNFSTEIIIARWGAHRTSYGIFNFLKNPIVAPTSAYALLVEGDTVATTTPIWLSYGYLLVEV